MHSWDILSQNANYEQNWCSTATTTPPTSASSLRSGIGIGTHIKIEPSPPSPSSEAPFDMDLKSNNNNNNNSSSTTAMLLGMAGLQQQQQQRNNESNPTSPHSIGSDESVNHTSTNHYYHDTLHSLINGRPLGFNPLTPPGYPLPNCLRPQDLNSIGESMLPTTPSRRSYVKSEATTAALTPIHTPPMDQTPPKSPKFNGSATATSDISEKDGTDLETGSISGDDTKSLYSDYNQEISKPKVNSHGKVKQHKCKHCTYVCVTKKDFWEHSRIHIKPEKQICCTKCPFVTEFKHHYEYHLRNHKGEKPFKCSECSYSCVNKSMLNSHLKSHSDVYQYRCENCNYATKYVHSLKLHLRKYQHEPAVPLDTDGVPDPMPIIDVHGTRRGPKKRKAAAKREAKKLANRMLKLKESCSNNAANSNNNSPQKAVQVSQLHSSQQQQQHQQSLNQQQQQQQQLSQQQQQQSQQALSNFLPPFIPNNIANMLPYFNLPQMLALQQQVLAAARCNGVGGRSTAAYENLACDDDDDDEDDDMNMTINGANNSMRHMHNDLDLNHPESPTSSVPNNSHPNSLNNSGNLHRISGHDDDRHNSFDCHNTKSANFIDKSSDLSAAITTSNAIAQNAVAAAAAAATTANVTSPTPPIKMYDCKHCGISYQNRIIYEIHMGYHGYNDVFTCNMCGEKCDDPISFFLHITKEAHP